MPDVFSLIFSIIIDLAKKMPEVSQVIIDLVFEIAEQIFDFSGD
jgi:hypothetical protein